MSKKFEIDWESADRITVLNLKEALEYMETENKKFRKKKSLSDYEKADFEYNTRMIMHIKEVLKHYGE